MRNPPRGGSFPSAFARCQAKTAFAPGTGRLPACAAPCAPWIEALRGNARLASALSAITAAVVGVIVNLAVWFGLHVLFGDLRLVPGLFGVRLTVPVWTTLTAALRAVYRLLAAELRHGVTPRAPVVSVAAQSSGNPQQFGRQRGGRRLANAYLSYGPRDWDQARTEDAIVEHDLTEERARPIRTRFELAVRRMMNAWLAAGRIRVSQADVKLACEYLEYQGCHVEGAPGALYRLTSEEGHAEEMTGEATVITAMRRLATPEE